MWILILALLLPATTQAQTPPPKRWAARVVTKYTGTFLAPSNDPFSSSMSVIAQGLYQASSRTTLQATWGFNQKVEPFQEFTLTNPEFRMFYRLAGEDRGWSWSAGPTGALPLSQNSQNESLYFAVGAATRLKFDNRSPSGTGLLLFYDLGLNRNVHQYETSNLAESNIMSSIDHLFYLAYGFDSPVSVNAWIGFSSAWTYLSVISNNYTLGQEVTYTLSDFWDVAFGHERGGDFLSPNGQAYNFGLFDAEESRLYGALTLKL